MKKKCFMVVFIAIIGIIVLDSTLAIVNKTSPIIKIRYVYNNEISHIDKGVFFDTYYCSDNSKKKILKTNKYDCINKKQQENLEEKTTISSTTSTINKKTSTTKTTTKTSIVKSKKKEHIASLLEKKYIELGYIEKEELNKINVLEIYEDGYYKSNPEEKYYQIKFVYECKNKTNDCINYKIESSHNNLPCSLIWLIMKDNKIIQLKRGITININSDYVRSSLIIE